MLPVFLGKANGRKNSKVNVDVGFVYRYPESIEHDKGFRCTPGSYCPKGSSEQLLCPPGTYGIQPAAESMGSCQPCPVGFQASTC